MIRERADELLSQLGPVDNLPSIPDVVLRATAILESDSGDVDELGSVISRDPGLTSQLLRVANSVLYSSLGEPIDSLPAAIMRLGFEEVSILCLTVGAMSAFEDDSSNDLDDFWSHSATTAIAAGELAHIAEEVDLERAEKPGIASPYYLAGLLHDVGVLVCRGAVPEKYDEVLKKNAIAREPLYITESDILGFHHGEVGAALAYSWGLPDLVVASAEWHHQPQHAPDEHRTAVEIVHLADWMTHHMGIGDAGDGVIDRFDDQAWIDVGLDIEQFPHLMSSLSEAAQAARVLARSKA